MRLAVFLLTGFQAVLLIAATVSVAMTRTDAAGMGMAWGFMVIGYAIFLVFAAPALILALLRKALVCAVILAAIPMVGLVFALLSDVI